MKRNCGLDIFRILCCIGVLNYHVIDDVLECGGGAYILYYGSSFCVPGFFLLSGFLIGAKEKKSMDYFENKILITMQKLFGWIIFWGTVNYIFTAEITDVWNDFLQGCVGEGTLPVAWFLFMYVFLLIIAYPMFSLIEKKIIPFSIVITIWMVLIAMGLGNSMVMSKPQSLWGHLYVGYFAIGMVLGRIEAEYRMLCGKWQLLIASGLFCLCSYVYGKKYNIGIPYQHYGKWYYTVWLISFFVIIYQINFKNKNIKKAIAKIGNNTFVIYLGHLPLLLYITNHRPLRNIPEAILMVLFLFVGLNIGAEFFRRIPLLRKIV